MRPHPLLLCLPLLAASCLVRVHVDEDHRPAREARSTRAVAVEAKGADAYARAQSGEEREALHVPVETFTLPNGMRVALLEDHSLPKVVVNTWFHVGSKDEKPGRTGFAHLFEHLMFMGTERAPHYDQIMESGGGSNNASTSEDRTNYFADGPSEMLPTLLWLDADRFATLADAMTQEKLDAQRAVVRNERRQTSENRPYGEARLRLPELLYPPGHPYHHSVIGSHEDLEAATVEDVVEFFRTWYVPGNATLCVAGDFDPVETRALVERTMGAVPLQPVPPPTAAEPVRLAQEKRLVLSDDVQFPKLHLYWHSPALLAPGDAEMDLIAHIVGGGPSSRLEQRLVVETGLAQQVYAFQDSLRLGSNFGIEALAAPGVDVDELAREIHAVLEELAESGPTQEELARVKVATESQFLRGTEDLGRRADRVNSYLASFGVADAFQRDLDRYLDATAGGVREWARRVFRAPCVDLRVYPERAAAAADLDERPADLPARPYEPPRAETFSLSNGVAVHMIARPGSGLFAGELVSAGGAAALPADQAGLADLTAAVIDAGAGGRDAAALARAAESLGASIGARAGRETFGVSVSGLTSRLDATLDLFADLVLRPNLASADFEREHKLALAGLEARQDDPRSVAGLVARAVTFGREDPRGIPTSGFVRTVEKLGPADVRAARARLLSPGATQLVFVGDFDREALQDALERRFGSWRAEAAPPPAPPPALTDSGPGGIYLVDRPGAPQTVISMLRPVPPVDGVERMARECVDTVLGGSFISRLNANLREDKGYTYGASGGTGQSGAQFLLYAGSSVFTEKTGPALVEFRRELDGLTQGGITAEELERARKTVRARLVEAAATTRSLTRSLTGLVTDGRPLDATARELADLERVTLADANRVAQSGIYAFDTLKIALVGDGDAVRAQLAEAGLAEPVELTADGAPVQ